MFKLPGVGKSCVFSTVKLRAIVCVHSVRNTVTCEMLFCHVNDCRRGGLRQLVDFPVPTECIYCYQKVVTLKAVQVLSHYTPRSAWQLRGYQWFFRLHCLVLCTEAAITHCFFDLTAHIRPKKSIFGPSETSLLSLMTCMDALHHFFASCSWNNDTITFVQHPIVHSNFVTVSPILSNQWFDFLLSLWPSP